MASVTISIPESVAPVLGVGGELPRWALEAMLVEAVREGHASRGFLRDALGLSVGQADDLLASRGVLYDFTQEELEREAGVIAARRS